MSAVFTLVEKTLNRKYSWCLQWYKGRVCSQRANRMLSYFQSSENCMLGYGRESGDSLGKWLWQVMGREPGVRTEKLPNAVLASQPWKQRGRKVDWQGRGNSPQWVPTELWKLPREWGLKIDTEVDSKQLHLDISAHSSPSRNICLSEFHSSTGTKHCPKAHEGRRGLVSSYRLQPISEGSQHGRKQEFGAETWGGSHGGTLHAGLLRFMPT